MKDHALQLVRSRCSEHLEQVASLFKPGVKLTLLVRTPGQPERDFMLTDDAIDEAIDSLERAKVRASDNG